MAGWAAAQWARRPAPRATSSQLRSASSICRSSCSAASARVTARRESPPSSAVAARCSCWRASARTRAACRGLLRVRGPTHR
eukprot:1000939-Rhodomonas_salina.3